MNQDKSERFLSAFSSIEKHIRMIAGGRRENGFCSLLSSATKQSATVRRFEIDLQEFADLRNAIVHERSDGHPIAEPHQKTVEQLERILELISKPPTVDSLRRIQVVTCSPEEPIGKAARAMFEGQFSQLPVYQNNQFIGLLTSETIARWVADKFKPGEDLLEEESVGRVLPYCEENSICKFISRTTKIDEVLMLFDRVSHNGKSLDAVIITESGRQNQFPLNILTIFDLPQLYRKAGLNSD